MDTPPFPERLRGFVLNEESARMGTLILEDGWAVTRYDDDGDIVQRTLLPSIESATAVYTRFKDHIRATYTEGSPLMKETVNKRTGTHTLHHPSLPKPLLVVRRLVKKNQKKREL